MTWQWVVIIVAGFVLVAVFRYCDMREKVGILVMQLAHESQEQAAREVQDEG